MSLEWREQLSVGNDVIDSDHKYLIEIINRVEKGFATNDREALRTALDSLFQYSKTHFEAEEKIASAAGYSAVPRLHDSHMALLDSLNLLRRKFAGEWTPALIEHFTALLRDWLMNHVIKEDLMMKPFLTKRSPKFDPR